MSDWSDAQLSRLLADVLTDAFATGRDQDEPGPVERRAMIEETRETSQCPSDTN